jgi:hypothetical protein
MRKIVFFLCTSIVGLATNSWAVTSESLSKGHLSASSDRFPFINLTFSIPSNGTLLSQDNFSITEDSKPQFIREFIPPESSSGPDTSPVRAVDIVFVHDDSSSMRDEAEQVKANIQSFLDALSKSGLDFRLGLVPYGGNTSSPAEGLILNNGNLHSDGASLIADINQMGFDGGTEKAYAAMQLAVDRINWRSGAQKVLILVTDTGCDLEPENCIGSPTEDELTAKLQEKNVTVYSLTQGAQEFERIAAAINGKVFNVLADFSVVLNEIGTTLSEQYSLQYETDNLAEDGQTRTVELTVKVSGLQETFTAFFTRIAALKTALTPGTKTLNETPQLDQVSIPIEAEIERKGSSAVVSASLFYKQKQEPNFSKVPMTDLGNNIYGADIPAGSVLTPFVSYYIEAVDAEGKTTLPSVDPAVQPFVISVLPNVSPLITHTPVTLVQEGQDIDISASVTDTTNQVSKVTLYYRKTGRVVYQLISQEFNNQTDVLFTATIPGNVVTSNGIEYYLSAEDDFGASSTAGTSDEPKAPQVNAGPVITHTPVTSAITEQAIGISAKLVDTNNHVSKATLYYRKTGEVAYQSISNEFNQSEVDFTGSIPGNVVTTIGIEYYLYAEDDFGTSRTFATPDAPQKVSVHEDENYGGCSHFALKNRHVASFDPLFPLLVLVSLLYIYRRRRFTNI